MKLLITTKPISGITDAFAVSPSDLNNVKLQLYLNSQVWDEAEVELSNDMSPDQFHWKSPRTKLFIHVPDDLSIQGLTLLCYLFPDKAMQLRVKYSQGDIASLGGLLNE